MPSFVLDSRETVENKTGRFPPSGHVYSLTEIPGKACAARGHRVIMAEHEIGGEKCKD